MEHASVQAIKAKLQAYRRKYYLNRILRGGVVLGLLVSSLFVLFVLTEGYLWMSVPVRTTLFWGLILSTLGVLGYGIVWPATKYFNLTPSLSDAEAAALIGQHFPDIDDKLLNLLQLSQTSDQDNSLLLAAIEQRTEELRPVPFTAAINLKPNWRLARYIAVPVVILLLVFAINPDAISEGAYRLLNYNEHFNPPPPFQISVPDHANELVDGATHTVHIGLTGEELPGELYVYIKKARDLEFQRYSLERLNTASYEFTFKNVHEEFEYYISNDRYGSGTFKTEVLRRPAIGNFQVVLIYPGYTGRGVDTLPPNVGDIQAPVGTRAQWVFSLRGPVQRATFISPTDTAGIALGDAQSDGTPGQYARSLMREEQYQIALRSDRGIRNADTVRYGIQVIADKYPSITIRQPASDLLMPNTGMVMLEADFADDYGFTRAELFYRFARSNDPSKISQEYKKVALPLPPGGGNVATLNQRVDFIALGAAQGDEMEYYVRIWDNDGVAGPKASTSQVQRINYASVRDQYEQMNENTEAINEQLREMMQRSRQLGQQFEQMQQNLLSRPNMSYEDQRQMQSMMQEQRQLQQQMQELSERLQQNIEMSQENELLTPETLERMEQLRQMMERMANSPAMERLQRMQEQMRDQNRQQMQRQSEDMRNQQERMQQDIERTMELFRQMEIDQRVQEMIQRLDDMQQRQEMLEERTEQADTPQEMSQIQDRQEELRREMNEVREDLNALQELKNQSENPDSAAMERLQELAQDAQERMEQADQNLENAEQQQRQAEQQQQQGNNRESRQSRQNSQQQQRQAQQQQQQSQEDMEEMQEQLSEMQHDDEMQQAAENYEDLRALLENLLSLSFDQEALRDRMRGLAPTDPQVIELTRKQDKIRDDMAMIEDSLVALANRAIEIKPLVTEELANIDHALTQTMRLLDNNQVPAANGQQHQVMTHVNNLANMLVESLNQMQQQMRQMAGQSGKQCKKPNGSGGSMQGLSQQQQQLNEQMRRMMEQMGQQPGGQQGNEGQMQRLSDMAGQQESIRRQIQEMYQRIQQGQQEGGMGNLGNIAGQMQETEEDLRNAQLTEQMLQRQQQILSRMLDYDRAMREREYENRRESRTGQEQDNTPPAELEPEQLRQRMRREQFGSPKYRYSPTYRALIDQYYQLLERN